MEPLPVDVAQLQRRDPMAWTTLLTRATEREAMIVTAVTSEPLWTSFLAPTGRTTRTWSRQVTRYLLTIDGCSDPLSFVGKRTNTIEAQIYRHLGARLPAVFVPCHYIHMAGDRSWLLLDEAPNAFPPSSWVPQDIDSVAAGLAAVHAAFWEDANESELLDWLPFYFETNGAAAVLADVRSERLSLIEGPDAILSEHGLRSAAGLAEGFVRAAEGLAIMRQLGGWPGVLREPHLTALADLLDDPVPMLGALRDLPVSVIHTTPHAYNWHLSLFGDTYLLDWSEARLGPGVLDLVAFLETYPLLFVEDVLPRTLWPSAGEGPDRDEVHVRVRELTTALEETAVDTYLLAMSAELGSRFPARQLRQALPAARCLYVLLTWLPYFATWADDLPSRAVWQRVNRMSEAELAENGLGPMVGIRPYFSGVFERFLTAYRNL
jgi:hypothetical protein